jgi:hypothetical protein
LDVIKVAFCSPKKLADSDVWVLEVLSTSSFDVKESMVKLTMISNARATMAKLIDMNILMRLWRIFSASKLLVCFFPKYFKLAKIAMVQVLGNMEDEQCFSSLTFCKYKLHNQLTMNLGLVVRMFSQKFYTLHNFPYVEAFEQWWA